MTTDRSIRLFLMLAAPAALLAACGPSDPGTPGTGSDTDRTDTDGGGPPILTEDTAFPPGDSGSLMLYRKTHLDGKKVTELVGLFVDEAPPFTNLAHCAVRGGPCIEVLPTDDDQWVEFDRERAFDPLFSDYRYVGQDVFLGPWSAPYVNTPDMSYYYKDLTRELEGAEIRGDFGVSFGVQWGDYQGSRDIRVSNDIELYNPQPNTHLRINDGDVIPIRWTPNGEGEVYLTIQGGKLYARIYLLKDDGYHDLDVDDLQLGTDPVDLEFSLSRWNRNTITHRGNSLDLTATSEVVWTGNYIFTAGRTELVTSDTCDEAHNLPRLESGHYWGELNKGERADDITLPGNGCTGSTPSGRDSVARVVLPKNTAIAVTYDLKDENGTMYLLDDCKDPNSCLAGADTDYVLPEYITYFNDTGADVEAFLVLDSSKPDLTMVDRVLYYLDVDITTLEAPQLFDVCLDAQNMNPPTGEGSYFTDQVSFDALMNPGVQGCTKSDLYGPEGMTKITLQAGETLTVNVDMPEGDPGIYLLYNCTQASSCAAGADNEIAVDLDDDGDIDEGTTEALRYTNPSAGSENLYLFIDTKYSALKPFRMTIDIQ